MTENPDHFVKETSDDNYMDGNINLVHAIFQQTIEDIVAFPYPDFQFAEKYETDTKGEASIDAYYFLSDKTGAFTYYCDLLGVDPEETKKNVKRAILLKIAKNEKKKWNRFFKRQEQETCNAHHADILAYMLCDLVTRIQAIRLYAEEHVLNAA